MSKTITTFLALALFVTVANSQHPTERASYKNKAAKKPTSLVFECRKTKEIAVYNYTPEYDNLMTPDKQKTIKFSIVDRSEVALLKDTFEYVPIEGSELGTIPNAVVYLKDSNQILQRGLIVGAWQFVLLGDNWNELFPLTDDAVKILQKHLKKK